MSCHEPACRIIAKCGGVRRLARMLDVSPSTVCRWKQPRSAKGTGGLIPARHQARLLNAARDHDITITAEELIQDRPAPI